jgi:hypothetical protein
VDATTYVASLLQALSRPSCSLQMSAMGFWEAQLIVIGPYCVLAACFKRQPCTLVGLGRFGVKQSRKAVLEPR